MTRQAALIPPSTKKHPNSMDRSMKTAVKIRDIVIAEYKNNLPNFIPSYLASLESLKNGNLTRHISEKKKLNKIPNRSGNTKEKDMGLALQLEKTTAGLYIHEDNDRTNSAIVVEVRASDTKNHLRSTYLKLPDEGKEVFNERIIICQNSIRKPTTFVVFKLLNVPLNMIKFSKKSKNRIDIDTSSMKRIIGWDNLNSELLKYT